ncbi:MAG: hypothetical protein KDI09_00075 [Halioglobus sp.]|nr:hypothetical protein [Halioglobus sp.]
MYRYSVDNAVTYLPSDIILFRESPFAAWMERLALENPDHGIPPDTDSHPPRDIAERQDDLVDTLRAEGRDVVLVDDILDEGHTVAALIADARERGAASVRLVALCEKCHERRMPGVSADVVGLEVPDRYVFGYGMDCYERGRQLPAIYALKEG